MVVLAVLAVVGIAGTITFERAWSGLKGQNDAAAAAKQEASAFLVACDQLRREGRGATSPT